MGDSLGNISSQTIATHTPPKIELLTATRDSPGREIVIIQKHRGFLWPISGAVGLVILGLSGIAVFNLMGESERLHR